MANKVIWQPQPKQAEFMARPEYEALYGGSAGGGKSDALLVEALRQVNIPHYRGILFRDTYPQLEALIDRSQQLYKQAFPKAKYNHSEKVWKFPSGAHIFFGYMKADQDRFNYQGKPYDFVGFDELTHFSKKQYDYLKSRNRPNGSGTRVYFRSTCNPDGKGLGWVKERFVTPAPPMTTLIEKVMVKMPDGRMKEMERDRIFVPASVFDNQILLDNDPEYLATLASLPEAERNALLYGQWDSFSGQVFREWRNDPMHYGDGFWTHVVKPFDIPADWKIIRGFDFGFSRPFSVGWFAIKPSMRGERYNKIYLIREYYGCTGEPNVGLMITPQEIAKNIRDIENSDPLLKGHKITNGIADPAIFDKSRGDSVADMMAQSPFFIYWTGGDNHRLLGKMQMHYRFAFNEKGECMFQVFNTCKDFIRTVPMLTYSDRHPEDIDTDEEDHVYDMTRYVLQENEIAPRANYLEQIDYNDPLNQRINNTRTSSYINI